MLALREDEDDAIAVCMRQVGLFLFEVDQLLLVDKGEADGSGFYRDWMLVQDVLDVLLAGFRSEDVQFVPFESCGEGVEGEEAWHLTAIERFGDEFRDDWATRYQSVDGNCASCQRSKDTHHSFCSQLHIELSEIAVNIDGFNRLTRA